MKGISGEQLLVFATTFAISISQGKTKDELEFLSHLFAQISSSIKTISSIRSQNGTHEKTNNDTKTDKTKTKK